MTNLAKVVTSLIAEHMEQVVEDAFQHSRPCDEHVELSQIKKPEKDVKKKKKDQDTCPCSGDQPRVFEPH